MDIRQLFATNLRRIRHEAEMSQEALAHEAGVDRAYVSRIEREVTYVGLEIIERFSTVLKVHPSAFFTPVEAPIRGKRRSTDRRSAQSGL